MDPFWKKSPVGLLFLLGCALFLAALPTNCLSGDGRGFLANSTPFRGYWLILFSLWLPFAGFYGLPWLLVGAACAFALVAPLMFAAEVYDNSRAPTRVYIFWSVLSLAGVPVPFVGWEGYFIGAWMWALSVVITCAAAITWVIVRGPRTLHQPPPTFEVLPRN